MTRHVVVAVFDSAMQTFGRPAVFPARPVAVRAFTDEVNSGQDTPICKHPDDFELKCLGTYEDVDGSFVCEEGVFTLVRGKDVVKS